MNIKEIAIKDIQVVENSRISIKNLEGLMQDIKQHGLKQPIGVTETASGDYVLIFGHRRLSAFQKLGYKTIPANVYPDMEIADLLINNSAENLHREDTSPVELGRIIHRLNKEMGLSLSEISARLSIPVGRLNISYSAYKGLPTKYRDHVANVGGGNDRKGKIPASVAAKILATKRQYTLSDLAVDKLLNVARMEDYGMAELKVLSDLLKNGLTVTQAIEKSKRYRLHRFDTVVDMDEINASMKKNNMDSSGKLIESIIYGEAPPLKRPDFSKLT